MRLILVLFLLMCCKVSTAQFVVQGTVQDNVGVPLINARVEINSHDQYCYSDNNGMFYYDSPTLIKTISISYLGYKAIQQQYESTPQQDTLTVYFKLYQDENLLDTININATSNTEVYTERNYTVLDFKLLPNTILVLMKGKKGYYLKEFNRLNEQIREQKLSFKLTQIVSDCFGQIHLKNDVSYYLLNLNNFGLSGAQSLSDYNHYNAPCVAEFDSTLFIRNRLSNNQSIIYTVMNKATRKKSVLHTITDEESAYIAQYYRERGGMSDYIKITEDMYPEYGKIPNPGQLNADMVLDILEDGDWYSQVLSNPTYQPLFKINDSVYIFDHLESRCSVYDGKGRPFRSFQINHHLSNNWENRIIINQDNSKIYALMTSTHYFLLEINLSNGKIKNTYALDFNCSLSPKFEIRGNVIYYIYKQNKTNGFMKLYKQKITSFY